MKRKLKVAIILFLISVLFCGCHGERNPESSVEETMTEEHQSKEETANKIENEWTQEYIDIINGDSFLYEQYALIFLDEDDIPELVGNNPDMAYQILSVSMEGKTVYYENLPYGTYSREYYYLPSQSSIVSTCTGIGGKGRYEEYYSVGEENVTYQMTIGKVPESDEEGNLLYDDAGNFVWSYEKNDSEITEEEWETLSVLDERYVNFSQLPYLTEDEMVNVLKNPELINESYGIVSAGNSDEMLQSEDELQTNAEPIKETVTDNYSISISDATASTELQDITDERVSIQVPSFSYNEESTQNDESAQTTINKELQLTSVGEHLEILESEDELSDLKEYQVDYAITKADEDMVSVQYYGHFYTITGAVVFSRGITINTITGEKIPVEQYVKIDANLLEDARNDKIIFDSSAGYEEEDMLYFLETFISDYEAGYVDSYDCYFLDDLTVNLIVSTQGGNSNYFVVQIPLQ